MEEKRIKFYQFLIGTGDYTKDFGSFETQFFKDEVSVKKYGVLFYKNYITQNHLKILCHNMHVI